MWIFWSTRMRHLFIAPIFPHYQYLCLMCSDKKESLPKSSFVDMVSFAYSITNSNGTSLDSLVEEIAEMLVNRLSRTIVLHILRISCSMVSKIKVLCFLKSKPQSFVLSKVSVSLEQTPSLSIQLIHSHFDVGYFMNGSNPTMLVV